MSVFSGYVGRSGRAGRNAIADSLARIPWGLVALIGGLAVFGTMMLYSSTITNPNEAELPAKHAVRFAIALAMMIALAITPLSVWMRAAYPAYAVTLSLLLAVEFFGVTGGGAQRWLQVGPVAIQPSEIMKLALTLTLARYYQTMLRRTSGRIIVHLPAMLITAIPAVLVIVQPDLGTTLMLLATGGAIIFFAGLSKWLIGGVVAVQLLSMPLVHFVMLKEDERAQPASWLGLGSVVYYFGLEDYQRERVDALLSPGESEDYKLGAGYQAEQAKIAIGSGGLEGKGFTQGIQSQLDFIPEQHTDFIFTVVAEEFGFAGSAGLMLVWGVVLGWGLLIAHRCKSLFGKFAATGAVATVAFYVAFNIGMVSGLLPVVGIPLPLISYGGSAMITVMAAFGLILSAHVHRDSRLGGAQGV
ncbi:MAG: rod shape-determining protein RodA [Pseudomonadota bacterium]